MYILIGCLTRKQKNKTNKMLATAINQIKNRKTKEPETEGTSNKPVIVKKQSLKNLLFGDVSEQSEILSKSKSLKSKKHEKQEEKPEEEEEE